MTPTRDVTAILDADYLEVRAKVLEIAAALDRLERAPESHIHPPDRRLAEIRQAIEALLEPGPGRAETIQRIFSLAYDPVWMERFGLGKGS